MKELNEEQIEESLRKADVKPDKAWSNRTLAILEAEADRDVTDSQLSRKDNQNVFKFFNILVMKKSLFVGLLVFFGVLAISGISVAAYMYFNRDSTGDTTEEGGGVAEEEEEEELIKFARVSVSSTQGVESVDPRYQYGKVMIENYTVQSLDGEYKLEKSEMSLGDNELFIIDGSFSDSIDKFVALDEVTFIHEFAGVEKPFRAYEMWAYEVEGGGKQKVTDRYVANYDISNNLSKLAVMEYTVKEVKKDAGGSNMYNVILELYLVIYDYESLEKLSQTKLSNATVYVDIPFESTVENEIITKLDDLKEINLNGGNLFISVDGETGNELLFLKVRLSDQGTNVVYEKSHLYTIRDGKSVKLEDSRNLQKLSSVGPFFDDVEYLWLGEEKISYITHIIEDYYNIVGFNINTIDVVTGKKDTQEIGAEVIDFVAWKDGKYVYTGMDYQTGKNELGLVDHTLSDIKKQVYFTVEEEDTEYPSTVFIDYVDPVQETVYFHVTRWGDEYPGGSFDEYYLLLVSTGEVIDTPEF